MHKIFIKIKSKLIIQSCEMYRGVCLVEVQKYHGFLSFCYLFVTLRINCIGNSFRNNILANIFTYLASRSFL